jgi:hypothetical protein
MGETMSQKHKVFQLNLFIYLDDGLWIDPQSGRRFTFLACTVTAENFDDAEKFALETVKPQYAGVFKVTLTETSIEVDADVTARRSVADADITDKKVTLFEDTSR